MRIVHIHPQVEQSAEMLEKLRRQVVAALLAAAVEAAA